MPTVKQYNEDPIHEDVRAFEMELKQVFPDMVITSGFRKGAKTKAGAPSRHGKGEAIDLRYNKEMANYLWNTREGVALLNKYDLGFLDESTPEVMKRTGASGKHLHIGRDSTLVPKTRQRYKELWGSEKTSVQGESINPNTTVLDKPQESVNFTGNYQPNHTRLGIGLPDPKKVDEEKKNQPKEKEDTSKEKEALLQKQKENKFLKDYIDGIALEGSIQQPQQEEEPQQEEPQTDSLQKYGEISSFLENPVFQKGGEVMTSKNGVFDSKGTPVRVPSPNITMKGVGYPILGISEETGEQKVMMPELDYYFDNTQNVLEIPMMQKGGEKQHSLLDYMINDLSNEKGGDRDTYNNLKDSIAYHESGHTMNPNIVQKGSGIGRGKYMFEGDKGSNRILTAAKRTANYFKEKGKETPKYVKEIIKKGTGDASKLSGEQQDILFFGDLRMGKLDLKEYVDGNISIQDLWADYWWKGDKKDRDERISQFNTSLDKYNKKYQK